MKNIRLLLLFSLLTTSCSTYHLHLKNGDLIFVGASENSLSGAIDRVTQTNEETHFSHVALLEKEGKNWWILHAGTHNGSERIPLDTFLTQQNQDSSLFVGYRLKSAFQKSIPNAILTAKKWLGKPYNYSYILSDEKLYCSDFVQRSFAKDSIFSLQPMTFINPKTGKTDDVWQQFYDRQHLEVPEGLPGCNPNGLAASEKLRKIGILKP